MVETFHSGNPLYIRLLDGSFGTFIGYPQPGKVIGLQVYLDHLKNSKGHKGNSGWRMLDYLPYNLTVLLKAFSTAKMRMKAASEIFDLRHALRRCRSCPDEMRTRGPLPVRIEFMVQCGPEKCYLPRVPLRYISKVWNPHLDEFQHQWVKKNVDPLVKVAEYCGCYTEEDGDRLPRLHEVLEPSDSTYLVMSSFVAMSGGFGSYIRHNRCPLSAFNKEIGELKTIHIPDESLVRASDWACRNLGLPFGAKPSLLKLASVTHVGRNVVSPDAQGRRKPTLLRGMLKRGARRKFRHMTENVTEMLDCIEQVESVKRLFSEGVAMIEEGLATPETLLERVIDSGRVDNQTLFADVGIVRRNLLKLDEDNREYFVTMVFTCIVRLYRWEWFCKFCQGRKNVTGERWCITDFPSSVQEYTAFLDLRPPKQRGDNITPFIDLPSDSAGNPVMLTNPTNVARNFCPDLLTEIEPGTTLGKGWLRLGYRDVAHQFLEFVSELNGQANDIATASRLVLYPTSMLSDGLLISMTSHHRKQAGGEDTTPCIMFDTTTTRPCRYKGRMTAIDPQITNAPRNVNEGDAAGGRTDNGNGRLSHVPPGDSGTARTPPNGGHGTDDGDFPVGGFDEGDERHHGVDEVDEQEGDVARSVRQRVHSSGRLSSAGSVDRTPTASSFDLSKKESPRALCGKKIRDAFFTKIIFEDRGYEYTFHNLFAAVLRKHRQHRCRKGWDHRTKIGCLSIVEIFISYQSFKDKMKHFPSGCMDTNIPFEKQKMNVTDAEVGIFWENVHSFSLDLGPVGDRKLQAYLDASDYTGFMNQLSKGMCPFAAQWWKSKRNEYVEFRRSKRERETDDWSPFCEDWLLSPRSLE